MMKSESFGNTVYSIPPLYPLPNLTYPYQIEKGFLRPKEKSKNFSRFVRAQHTVASDFNILAVKESKVLNANNKFAVHDVSVFKKSSKKQKIPQFVNLLMKHGKKSRAKSILEKSLYLFVLNLSKITGFPNSKAKHCGENKCIEIGKENRLYRCFYPFLEKEKGIKLQNPIKKDQVFLSNCKWIKASLSEKDSKRSFTFSDLDFGHVEVKDKLTSGLMTRASTMAWSESAVATSSQDLSLVFYNFYHLKIFFFGKYKSKFWQLPLSKKKFSINCQTSSLKKLSVLQVLKYGCLFWAKPKDSDNFIFNKLLVFAITKPPVKNSWFKNARVFPFSCALDIQSTPLVLTIAQKNTFLFSLYKAISNVKPPLECRAKRFGGTNRQIPATVSEQRQWGYAMRWIIEAAQNLSKSKKNRPFKEYSLKALGKYNPAPFASKKKRYISDLQTKDYNLQEEFYRKGRNYSYKAKKQTVLTVHSKIPDFCFFLAESLLYAYYKRGYAYKKRNLWIETSLANRAYLRYRWW